jgi:WD40 repeat protein
MLIVLFSVAIVAYGQTERFIGKGKVRAIQFSPDGRRLAIGTSAILELYEAKTYRLVHTIKMNVDALEFSPNGTEMMVADGRLVYCIDSTAPRVR